MSENENGRHRKGCLVVPTGWARTRFGEIVELLYGKGLPKSVRNPHGEHPVYGSNGIVGFHDSFLIEGPAIVVGRKGSAGTVAFSSRACWPIDTTYYVRKSDHVDLRFAFHLISSLRLDQFDRSTAVPGLNRNDVYDLEVSLPPLREQRRIVAKIDALFSELDAGIERLEKARAQLSTYRQSILKHAFEGKLTARWREENSRRLRSPGQLLADIEQKKEAHYERQMQNWKSAVTAWIGQGRCGGRPRKPSRGSAVTALAREVISTLPKLPDSWVWGKLARMTSGVEYGTSSKSAQTGDVPVLRMGNIHGAQFDWSDLVYTSDQDEIERYRLNDGDVLFNRTNSPELVGKTAVYRGGRAAVFAGYLIRINHMISVVDSQYLNLFLNSYIARQHGNSVKTDGVNQSNISGAKLLDYPFPYCSIDEQRKMVSILGRVLSQVDEMDNGIIRQIDLAGTLRQAILQKAFSGQLVPQDTSEEPASLLLSRISAERVQTTKSAAHRKRAKVTT